MTTTTLLPNEQQEIVIKVLSLIVTFLFVGTLTCVLLAWLAWQLPGLEPVNQGIIICTLK